MLTCVCETWFQWLLCIVQFFLHWIFLFLLLQWPHLSRICSNFLKKINQIEQKLLLKSKADFFAAVCWAVFHSTGCWLLTRKAVFKKTHFWQVFSRSDVFSMQHTRGQSELIEEKSSKVCWISSHHLNVKWGLWDCVCEREAVSCWRHMMQIHL